jgi:hypothetical protein
MASYAPVQTPNGDRAALMCFCERRFEGCSRERSPSQASANARHRGYSATGESGSHYRRFTPWGTRVSSRVDALPGAVEPRRRLVRRMRRHCTDPIPSADGRCCLRFFECAYIRTEAVIPRLISTGNSECWEFMSNVSSVYHKTFYPAYDAVLAAVRKPLYVSRITAHQTRNAAGNSRVPSHELMHHDGLVQRPRS